MADDDHVNVHLLFTIVRVMISDDFGCRRAETEDDSEAEGEMIAYPILAVLKFVGLCGFV